MSMIVYERKSIKSEKDFNNTRLVICHEPKDNANLNRKGESQSSSLKISKKSSNKSKIRNKNRGLHHKDVIEENKNSFKREVNKNIY